MTGARGRTDARRRAGEQAPSRRGEEETVDVSAESVEERGLLLRVDDAPSGAAADEVRRAEEAAVLRERERVAENVAHLISRPLFAASLELSGALQPGAERPRERIRAALADIDTAIAELRSLATDERLGQSWARWVS
jgi:hypothetical protein